MLAKAAYKILSTPKKILPDTLRFFLMLLAEYDLRDFTVLSTPRLAEQIKMPAMRINFSLSALVTLGLLERGPRVAIKNGVASTYRVRPQHLLTTTALKEQTKTLSLRQERSGLLP